MLSGRPSIRPSIARLQSRSSPVISEPNILVDDFEALNISSVFGQPPLIPMPDGERFVFVQNPGEQERIERIQIVLNWEQQLKR